MLFYTAIINIMDFISYYLLAICLLFLVFFLHAVYFICLPFSSYFVYTVILILCTFLYWWPFISLLLLAYRQICCLMLLATVVHCIIILSHLTTAKHTRISQYLLIVKILAWYHFWDHASPTLESGHANLYRGDLHTTQAPLSPVNLKSCFKLHDFHLLIGVIVKFHPLLVAEVNILKYLSSCCLHSKSRLQGDKQAAAFIHSSVKTINRNDRNVLRSMRTNTPHSSIQNQHTSANI